MARLDASCFTSFSGVWADFYQTISNPYTPDTPLTAEAAMRCGSPSGCKFYFQLEGTGISAGESKWSPAMTLPYGTGWYICRFDVDHVATDQPKFSSDHSTLWFEIRNEWGTELHVDYTFLGGKTERLQPGYIGTDGDAGSTCTLS